MPLKRVIIVYKPAKKCSDLISDYIGVLEEKGIRVDTIWVDEVKRGDLEGYDLVIAMGGDGTLLRISWSLCERLPLILPIPCGRRTVLYEDLDRFPAEEIIDRVLAGRFYIERISRIKASYGGEYRYALNEVAIITHDFGRALHLDISMRTPYTSTSFILEGDGVIIATPTGSSAYALSASGPIVEPGISGLLFIPLNPITLNIAPILVHPFSVVTVSPRDYSDLYIDGMHIETLPPSSKIIVKTANNELRIVRISDKRNLVKRVLEGRTTRFI